MACRAARPCRVVAAGLSAGRPGGRSLALSGDAPPERALRPSCGIVLDFPGDTHPERGERCRVTQGWRWWVKPGWDEGMGRNQFIGKWV